MFSSRACFEGRGFAGVEDVVLEKTLETLLDRKEIQPVLPKGKVFRLEPLMSP